MFDYLRMACTDSDNILMIAGLHLPKFIILVLKLTLLLEVRVLSISHHLPLLEHLPRLLLAIQLSGKAHGNSDYIAMIAVRC